ncbi:hypothetical protein MPLSOD_50108 [Mesorhizobium sp. SOD10]|nr:hypothetical protein MPLSOD_50108 [Mesorhizobium sp. SOD10]
MTELSCAWRLTKAKVTGGLPETSNRYCHPRKAGDISYIV